MSFTELLGYEENESDLSHTSADSSSAVKKQKFYSPKDEDWEYLITSEHGKNFENLNRTLKLPIVETKPITEKNFIKTLNPKSILFSYIRVIHYTLHLVYEDLKLNMLCSQDCMPLMKFLYQLSTDISLTEYIIYYWRDFPTEVSPNIQPSSISKNDLKHVVCNPVLMEKPASVMRYIYNLLNGIQQQPYPYLQNVNTRSRDIVQVMFYIISIFTKLLP